MCCLSYHVVIVFRDNQVKMYNIMCGGRGLVFVWENLAQGRTGSTDGSWVTLSKVMFSENVLCGGTSFSLNFPGYNKYNKEDMTETSQVKMECLMRVGKLSAISIHGKRNIIKRRYRLKWEKGARAKACFYFYMLIIFSYNIRIHSATQYTFTE